MKKTLAAGVVDSDTTAVTRRSTRRCEGLEAHEPRDDGLTRCRPRIPGLTKVHRERAGRRGHNPKVGAIADRETVNWRNALPL